MYLLKRGRLVDSLVFGNHLFLANLATLSWYHVIIVWNVGGGGSAAAGGNHLSKGAAAAPASSGRSAGQLALYCLVLVGVLDS